MQLHRSRGLIAVAGALALVGSAVTSAGALTGRSAGFRSQAGSTTPGGGDVDVRRAATTGQRAGLGARAALATDAPAMATLRSRLGSQAVLDVDPMTGTPRQVARLDGFLTGRSTASAAGVALGYVRANPGVFRLSAADLSGLRPARDYVDLTGTHHLSWLQTAGGLELAGNGLKANVAKDGRLISVLGSPVAGLRAPAALGRAALGSAAAAIGAARKDLHESSTAPGKADLGRQVLFQTPSGTRRAWSTITMSTRRPALHIFDAATGRLLYRHSLTDDANPQRPQAPAATAAATATPATALVFDNYPGAASGGAARQVNLSAPGWLPAGSPSLFGNNVHTYTDVNDDNATQSTEEIAPRPATSYRFAQTRVSVQGEPCGVFVCSWDPSVTGSWRANRAQTATQNFFSINVFHDHLAAAPIGFTEAAGNFQQLNASRQGKGHDPVLDEPLDGALTDHGMPDGGHIDNANMATPPDGISPRMQMYLFHAPGEPFPAGDPFIAVSGADEADIVYHEYTHGLSSRLVVNPDGTEALDTQQAGSMGEAWSDWYALDLLVAQGHVADTAAPGEVRVGDYVGTKHDLIRTEPLDCPVGSTSARCPGTAGAGRGGYTYGDFGTIIGFPEVHADGEIWAQTLWDLRAALGSRTAESLVTRGMELSPASPSFLDMRNSNLQADLVANGGAHTTTIWKVFAHRGMGFFAGTLDSTDVAPVEDFGVPPAGPANAELRGVVIDRDTQAPLAGVAVFFGGHNSGFVSDLAAVTDAAGRYRITGLFPGSYPDLVATAAGYLPAIRTQRVHAGVTFKAFSLQRDWAASAGGAAISETNADEFAPIGCGAAQLIDTAQASGWSTVDVDSRPERHAVVKLPVAVDISALKIDPSGICGDDPTSSTGDFRLETSVDGSTWQAAASGHFRPAQDGKLNVVALKAGTGTGVRFVRYTMLGTQLADFDIDCNVTFTSGCLFLDSAELVVLGSPA
jgi:extracellular elastinolytic metalloproteinase